MGHAALLNAAQRDPLAVVPWALAVLGDLIVPDDSPAANISSPTQSEAEGLADAIMNIPRILRSRALLASTRAQEDASNSQVMAFRIMGVIPRAPQWVNYAEVIDALAQAAGTKAEWEDQKTIRRQLIDAARATGEDVGDAVDAAMETAKRIIEDATPQIGFQIGIGAILGILVALYVVTRG